MEIRPVEQFVRENVSEFRLIRKRYKNRSFDLYNKCGKYCGQYFYTPTSRIYTDYFGSRVSMSVLEIFDESLNKIMQRIICQKKVNIEVKDHNKEIPVKVIPKTITTIVTTFDFVNDRFKTVERESVLQNALVRIGKNDKDFHYNENHVIYEELNEKPAYEQMIKVRKEGSISEVKNQEHINLTRHRGGSEGEFLGYPYIFWQ